MFAFEQPADSLEHAASLCKTDYFWYIYGLNDYSNFNFDFIPAPWQSEFVHVWPCQWQADGQVYLVHRNHIHGARHYHDGPPVHRLPHADWYHVPENIDSASVDWRWSPDPADPPYIYHFPSQHQSASGVTYTVPGAVNHKLTDAFCVHAHSDHTHWHIPDHIDPDTVDFTWHPNPLDPPYIYHFPSQHQSASGVAYTVPGATEHKLSDAFVVHAQPTTQHWRTLIPVTEFDYSWHPNVLDPEYQYVFGNQWNSSVLEPTVIYDQPGATEVKYMEQTATVAADMNQWRILDDVAEFDYTWRPNPMDPPYRYVFGNQWLTPEQRPALEYVVDSATELKYMSEPRARRVAKPEQFVTHVACEFDYSWEPDPGSPAYNYVFGNQHWPPEIMPTVEYHMPGATEVKFMSNPVAQIPVNTAHWSAITDLPFEFDYSWCPDPGDPPYIYQFGNQWYSAEIMPTVQYMVPGATEIKYVDSVRATLLPVMDRWSVPEEVNADVIDFSWCPHPGDAAFVYHFGSEYQISTGLTYTTPGATEPKFAGELPRKSTNVTALNVLDIFFVDRGNATAQTRFERLQTKYPGIQKVRYANSIMDTIKRCMTRSKTSKFWVISSEYSYDDFDFGWHAQPWQSYMTHVFPSQWQKWSDTFLINKWEFERHAKWATGLEQFPNLNFVQGQQVRKPDSLNHIYYVDHGNPESRDQYERLREHHPDIIMTRFVSDYLNTFKRIMNTAETEYVWIINSVCDYADFDFTWQPEPWQSEMIHVFPSDNQARGDTFYIQVESFRKQMIELALLDWFNVINYCKDQRVERIAMPFVHYEHDNLVAEVQQHEFKTPYAYFSNDEFFLNCYSAPCLWTEKDRVIERCTESGASAVVPRDVKSHLKTQLYDYPYIEDVSSTQIDPYELDIVFISNGEPEADHWYEHLQRIHIQQYASSYSSTKIKRVQNVNGRTAAYQAAARASDTPWFFAVFAKLEVSEQFDWGWQPDYFQEPKHYIFNAKNPVNGLIYGHQGMIAYNKRLVLSNTAPGIDFTLSQPHESVPVLSGVAHFNQDPWTTWRTAFREVLKLKHFQETAPTVETEHRLSVWCTQAQGMHADACLSGAHDALAYYAEVAGDYQKLKLSFDWAWLKQRYDRSND